MLSHYGNSTDNDTGAALWYISNRAITDDTAGMNTVWNAFRSQQPAAYNRVVARVTQLTKEAESRVGPYRIPVLLTGKAATQNGTVSGVGIQTGNDSWYPGVSITVRLTGPAVFQRTGTSTLTVTSTSQGQTFGWNATGAGKVSVSASSTKVLPGPNYTYYPAPNSNWQSMVAVSSNPVSAEGKDPVAFETAVTPKLGSQVSAAYLVAGVKPSDVVSMTDGLPNITVPVTGTLYGPLKAMPAESATVPAGTPQFDRVSGTITLNGSGAGNTTLTASKTITEAGYYVWVEQTAAVGAMQAVTGTFGRTSETTAKWDVQITSEVSAPVVPVDGKTAVNDSWKVAGINPIPGVALPTMQLTPTRAWLPADPTLKGEAVCRDRDWSTAKLTKLPAIKITGNQSGKLDDHVLPAETEAGCLSFGYTLTATSGSETLWTIDHPLGDPTQTAIIIKPTFKTRAVVTSDGQLVDEVMVFGTQGLPGTIDASLFTQPAKRQGATLVCGADWANAGKVTDLPAIQFTGDGTYKTQPYKLPEANIGYSFGATLTMANGTFTASEKPGVPAETLCYEGEKQGGEIESGIPGSQSSVPLGIAAVLLGGAAVGAVVTHRRSMKSHEEPAER